MTSTIYTAKHLSGGSNTTPLFSLKGLDNMAPASISHLGIEGVPLTRQLAYTEYASNISCFLQATNKRRAFNINGRPLGILMTKHTTFIKPPATHFTTKKPLNSDQTNRLLSSFGPGASTVVQGKTTIFQAPALPISMIGAAVNLCPSHFNCGRDAVNPSGAQAFQFLDGVCATFLRTHSYPAFTQETDKTLCEMNFLLAGHTKFLEPETTNKEGKTIPNFDPRLFSRTLADLAEDTGSMEVDGGELDQIKIEHKGAYTSSGVDAVLKAKPCPVPQQNIGSRAEAPNLPGIIFPYFHGLIQPDAVFLHSTILRHFFQLLGDTVQKCQDTFLTMRRGCGSLSTTKEGMCITHLLKGITLALETQTRCYMLFEAGEYKGFILYGAQFLVFDSTRWIVPGSEGEIQDAIRKMDPHESSIGHLVKLFSEMKAQDRYSGPVVTPATFTEPENLIEVFRGVNVGDLDAETEREIDKHLRGLNFMGDGYWPRNPQTVADMLKSLNSTTPAKLTRPTYFSSIKLPIHTKEYAALSRFGPESVSFWNERGTEVVCKATEKPQMSSGKRKAGEVDIYSNMPVKILVTPKPLSIAVSDLDKVIKKGCIKIDLGERAGKFRNMSVESEEARKLIWRELVELSRGAHNAKKVRTDMDAEDEVDFDDLIFKLTNQ